GADAELAEIGYGRAGGPRAGHLRARGERCGARPHARAEARVPHDRARPAGDGEAGERGCGALPRGARGDAGVADGDRPGQQERGAAGRGGADGADAAGPRRGDRGRRDLAADPPPGRADRGGAATRRRGDGDADPAADPGRDGRGADAAAGGDAGGRGARRGAAAVAVKDMSLRLPRVDRILEHPALTRSPVLRAIKRRWVHEALATARARALAGEATTAPDAETIAVAVAERLAAVMVPRPQALINA